MYSLIASRKAAGAVAGLGREIELDGVDTGVALAQTQLQVLSLSTRCCSTSNSSMNSGAGKPWPQISLSSRRAVSSEK
jgi:hypothetical protein